MTRSPQPSGWGLTLVEWMSEMDQIKCPECGAPEPRLHPATGADGGEVAYICPDPFHKGPNGGNK